MVRSKSHIAEIILPFLSDLGNCAARTAAATGDIILPRYCAVCGRTLLLHEKFICIYCLADLPFTYNWNMPHNRMADRFNEMIQRDIITSKHQNSDLLVRPESYAYAAALFFYRGESAYRKIPHRLKYHCDIGIGRHFGKMLGKRLAGVGQFSDVDMVIPVPLHWRRRWERGYNQAAVIASETAAALGAALREDILMRHRKTRTQTKLDVRGKMENVRQAFRIKKKFLANPPAAGHILLVDDVFTTGATIHACFLALRAVYTEDTRISAATLAFVDNG